MLLNLFIGASCYENLLLSLLLIWLNDRRAKIPALLPFSENSYQVFKQPTTGKTPLSTVD
jgi:hypothetical protein